MSRTVYEIPLVAAPQAFDLSIFGVTYSFRLTYMDAPEAGWIMDLSFSDGNPLVAGIPLVTGVNLLEQFPNIAIGGELFVATDGHPEAVPTFENLGTLSHLYLVV